MQKPPNAPSANTKVAPLGTVESKSGSTDTIEDDSFAMNSDDDAFFAAVDLDANLSSELEADVGRPLGEEEGIGGAIDFEEGTRGLDLEDEQDVAGPEEHFRRDLTNGSISRTAPSPHLERMKSSSSVLSIGQSPYGGHENQPAKQVYVPSNSGSRPRGGFHFPPGMNAPGAQPVHNASSNLAGTKRPADTMNSSRSFGQGMGLTQARSNGNGQSSKQQQYNRTPLAPLDIEGGQVKRVRR